MSTLRLTVTLGVSVLLRASAFAQTPAAPASRPAITMPARPGPLPPPAVAKPTVELLDRLSTPMFRETSGTLFENVVALLTSRYYDERFRTERLPAIVDKYRERARESVTLTEQRQVVHELLSEIPSSHLGLLSMSTHRALMADLLRLPYPNAGFQLVGLPEGFFAAMVLENGPAMRNGLLAGDRIVSIDGIDAAASPRLDWRSDDAYLGDERDPAIHQLIVAEGDTLALRVERRPGEFLNVTIPVEQYTAFDAARASARVLRQAGRQVGYLHFWFVHMAGVPDLLRETIDDEFEGVDALMIDLRGRGGSATEVNRILEILKEYKEKTGKPIVALVDRQSRSAKDVLAYEFRQMGVTLVGEPSAGAVIPAMFGDVGFDSVLMFPTFVLPGYSEKLELKPLDPDVRVDRVIPFAAGRDGILEAGLREAVRQIDLRPAPRR